MRPRRLFLALAVTAATMTVGVTPASAGDPPPMDLDTYLATLSPADAQHFRETMVPARVETSVVTVPMNRAAYLAANGLAAPMATKERCLSQRVVNTAVALAGNTLYKWSHTGYFCATGSVVTSNKILANQNLGVFTIGWRYAGDGDIQTGRGIINGQARSYGQGHYILGTAGIDIQHSYPCARFFGYANFTTGHDLICGLY